MIGYEGASVYVRSRQAISTTPLRWAQPAPSIDGRCAGRARRRSAPIVAEPGSKRHDPYADAARRLRERTQVKGHRLVCSPALFRTRGDPSRPKRTLGAYRVRERLVNQRTGVINQIRAFLLERGVAVRQGRHFLRAELPGANHCPSAASTKGARAPCLETHVFCERLRRSPRLRCDTWGQY
jgi:hypothetical protein